MTVNNGYFKINFNPLGAMVVAMIATSVSARDRDDCRFVIGFSNFINIIEHCFGIEVKRGRKSSDENRYAPGRGGSSVAGTANGDA